MAEYYTQRASAGLIVTEATVISEQGIGWVDSQSMKPARIPNALLEKLNS